MDLLAQGDAPTVFTAENIGWLISHSIVAAIAGWLGGMASRWLDRTHQSRIDERLRRLESGLAVTSHMQQRQFEDEVKILRELWQRVDDACRIAFHVRMVGDDDRPIHSNKLLEALAELQDTMNQHQPFYAGNIGDSCQNLLEVTNNVTLFVNVPMEATEENAEWLEETYESMLFHRTAVLNAVRLRMGQISDLPVSEEALALIERRHGLSMNFTPFPVPSSDDEEHDPQTREEVT